jgi:hypothetical protein
MLLARRLALAERHQCSHTSPKVTSQLPKGLAMSTFVPLGGNGIPIIPLQDEGRTTYTARGLQSISRSAQRS